MATIDPIIEEVFRSFGCKPRILAADSASMDIAVAHVGGHAMRATVFACLAHELSAKLPGRVTVQPIGLATPEARLRIVAVNGGWA